MNTPQWWQDKAHPIWSIAQMGAALCCALVLGYVNASHFDTGEVVTALGSVAAAKAFFRRGPS